MQRGMTVLLMACVVGHEEAAKIFVPPTLAAGALDVCSATFTGLVGDYAGYSALLWAEQWGLTSVVEMMHASGAADMKLPSLALSCREEARVQLDVTEQVVLRCARRSGARWALRATLIARSSIVMTRTPNTALCQLPLYACWEPRIQR